jgi:putative glutamine amidotransferase
MRKDWSMGSGEDGRPVIGMPARMDSGRERQHLSRQYGNSVFAAGGLPLIVPLVESPSETRKLASMLDGVLLTGSDSDVDPGRYGASRTPGCGPNQPLRDETDFLLLESAFERRVPVLGICFGLQSLNVFLGGTLIQDIGAAIRTGISHSGPEARDGAAHTVTLAPDSMLAALAGELEPWVNSSHHQAVDRPGRGLRVVANAPDGVVEGVVLDGGEQWVTAVQWHPERSFNKDLLSKRLFQTFVASCIERRDGA